jgi:adenosine deaminase
VSLTRELIQRLPKAELHVHLDGCLRPRTMVDLAQSLGVTLPSDDPDRLADAVFVRHAQSLEEYLDRYRFTVAVMQSASAMRRIAYEFVQDVAADNVRYVEVRYCPALHVPALSLTEAIEAPLAGFQQGETETGTVVRVIICGLRTLPPRVSADLARAAVEYRDDGVVAFDLAGSERGHPAVDHVAAFEHARGHGLNCTCHAGEGDGPESIRQALHICGAQRIGHGTRLHEDPDLEAEVIERGIPLEVCLTSNVHTHTVADVAEHPARRYLDRGGIVTLNCDSHLMDRTTLSNEYWLAHRELGLTRDELERVILDTFRSAFLDDEHKAILIAEVRRELSEIQ